MYKQAATSTRLTGLGGKGGASGSKGLAPLPRVFLTGTSGGGFGTS